MLSNRLRKEATEITEEDIAALSASQRGGIDDLDRGLQNERLARQAEALEIRGNWAQA